MFSRRNNLPLPLGSDPFLQPFIKELDRRKTHAEKLAKKLSLRNGSLADFASAHEFFGMHRKAKQWIFREYAPNAESITLVGDFSNWQISDKYQLTKRKNGVWEGKFPATEFCHLMHYKMFVSWHGGSGMRIPAYARYVVQDENSKLFSAVIWEPENNYSFQYSSPSPAAPIIYEAHTGIAQEEEKVGSFEEFRVKILPEIAKKNYNTVQLMAVMEHPYYGSFGYHVANFFAVSSRFGTPDDFKKLIDEAHRLGLHVIIDIVHSHAVKNEAEGIARLDGDRTTYFHAGPRGEHPGWDSLCFDYGKIEVLHFLLSNCRFFLDEYHVDGFRFDGITSMLYHHHGLNRCFVSYDDYFNNDIDLDALTYLTLANQVIHEVRSDAITIAEDVSGMPGLASPDGIGFDYRMAMGVTDMWFKMLDLPDESWDMFYLYGELTNRRCDEKSISYVECHDQAIVGGKTAFFRMADADMYYAMHRNSDNMVIDRAMALHKMMRLSTAATAAHGYLNFMGNEFGHPEWIDFPREGNNWSMSHARRLWSLEKNPNLRYKDLSAFDREIMKIISSKDFFNAPVQTVRIDNQGKVIAFERNDYWFFFNFNPTESFDNYEFEVLSGSYETILDSDDFSFGGFGHRTFPQRYFSMPRTFGEVISLYLPARTALVLKREK